MADALSQFSQGQINSPITAKGSAIVASDYPSNEFWAHFLETSKANGTTLADRAGNISDFNIVANGASVPGVRAEVLNLDLAASNECYAKNGTALPAALTTLGDNSVMLEVDINMTSADHTAGFIEVGNPFDGTDGYSLNWNTSGYPAMWCGGVNANSKKMNFTSCPSFTGSRAHLLAVWSRTSTDTTGTMSLYLNGSFVQSGAPDGDPGAIEINTNGRLSVGSRAGNVLANLDGDIHNARIWVVSSVPSNIADIASQMARNPDEYPLLMKDIS